jgi:uncharacterized protein (TIGR02246 family)
MKPRSMLQLTCLALLAFGAPPLHAQSDQGPKTMDHSQIQSTIDANNAAVAVQDMDAILATYEPNAVMATQPGTTATGTEALRGAFQYFLALSPKITVTNSEILQTGDLALHSYTWKMSGKDPDGSPVEQAGLSVNVLRKQADGRWLMAIDNPFGGHLLGKK